LTNFTTSQLSLEIDIPGFGLPQPISGKDSSFLEVQNSFMGIVEPSTPSQIGATGSQAVNDYHFLFFYALH